MSEKHTTYENGRAVHETSTEQRSNGDTVTHHTKLSDGSLGTTIRETVAVVTEHKNGDTSIVRK